jgi:hypothetical protein
MSKADFASQLLRKQQKPAKTAKTSPSIKP